MHSINSRIHKDEKVVIDRAIRTEFIIEANNLSEVMVSFFRENVNRILVLITNSKMQWLSSI